MINIVIMRKKSFRVVLMISATALVILAAIFAVKTLFPENDRSGVLRSLGYTVQMKDATFRGYSSQKISASKGSGQVMLQIVRNVQKDSSGEILKEFNTTIDTIQQKVVITNPYSGQQQELSLPESLKPIKKDVVINGSPVTYYLVYANEIFSMKIFSEAEAKYKGLFSTFYCPKEKAAYSLEIYSDIKHFDKQKSITLMTSLFCR